MLGDEALHYADVVAAELGNGNVGLDLVLVLEDAWKQRIWIHLLRNGSPFLTSLILLKLFNNLFTTRYSFSSLNQHPLLLIPMSLSNDGLSFSRMPHIWLQTESESQISIILGQRCLLIPSAFQQLWYLGFTNAFL